MNNIYCPNCGQRNDPHSTLCNYCGMKIYQIPKNRDFHCISCGAANKANSAYCSHCDFDFSKAENIRPGIKGAKTAQETVDSGSKNIFMQKGIYVVIGLILVIVWGISLFMPWMKPDCSLFQYGSLAAKWSQTAKHPFLFKLASVWIYLPFAAVILAVVSLIRKRIHSLVTYTGFAIPWIIGFVLWHFLMGWFDRSYSNIVCTGEIMFIVSIILFFGFDRLIYALNITRN